MLRNWRKQLLAGPGVDTAELADAARAVLGADAVKIDESLARFTTYRIGGPADVFAEVATIEQLQSLLPAVRDLSAPVTVLGGGSNVLIQDGGIRGLVIRLGKELSQIDVERTGEQDIVQVGAAASLGYLIKAGRQHGWAEIAPIAGTPGTVGGALKMNAGDRQTWLGDFVQEVRLVTRDGQVREIAADKAGYGYRKSNFPAGSVIVGARLAFEAGDPETATHAIDQHLDKRKATQPLNQPSGGSVFRNPDGHHAGELIERVGLKGVRLHNVQISDKHANFIVNLGDGRAKDVLALIRLARKKVNEETGIRLEEELRVIGEAAGDDEEADV